MVLSIEMPPVVFMLGRNPADLGEKPVSSEVCPAGWG